MSKLNAPLRLAFIGQAGSGKTTHARLMQQKYRGDVLSFATPLKKLTRELFGEAMDDEAFARRANQDLGVAVRHLDSNTWVRKLLEKVPDNRNTFVDDCRFFNEYNALKSLDFTFVRLMCNPVVLHERRPTMTAEQFQHESERDIIVMSAHVAVVTDVFSVEEAHTTLVDYLERYVIPTLGQTGTVEQPDASPDNTIPFVTIF